MIDQLYNFISKQKGVIKSEYNCGINELTIEANGIIALFMVADILESLGSTLDKTPMEIAYEALKVKSKIDVEK